MKTIHYILLVIAALAILAGYKILTESPAQPSQSARPTSSQFNLH
jgi:hypothetical protein